MDPACCLSFGQTSRQVRCKQQKQHLYQGVSQDTYHPALSKSEMRGSDNSLALARRLLQGTCFWLPDHENSVYLV